MDQNAAALVQENVSAIECQFDRGDKAYTYLIGWPLKPTDTHAIVHTGNEGLKVVKIVQAVEVPVGSPYKLRFAVSTFGVDDNKEAIAAYDAVSKQIADALRKRARAAFQQEVQTLIEGA